MEDTAMSDREPKKVRLSLEIPAEINRMLEEIADHLGSSKTEVIKRSLALAEAAHKARRENKIVGVMTQDHRLEKEFIGI
jgi:predicted transcriptional regulator